MQAPDGPDPERSALAARARRARLATTIFNYTVGSGIFALPALAMRAGGRAPLAFLVCMLVLALVLLCQTWSGSRPRRWETCWLPRGS